MASLAAQVMSDSTRSGVDAPAEKLLLIWDRNTVELAESTLTTTLMFGLAVWNSLTCFSR